LLLILGIIALVFWLLWRYRRSMQRNDGSIPTQIENMVRCAHCGIHLPRSESVERAGRYFCSTEHRRLYES